MKDELNPIEDFLNKSNTQVKWTTSISIFLITTIFTILTFKKNIFSPSAIIILIAVIPLVVSVYSGWNITYESFLLQRAIFDARSFPFDKELRTHIDKRVKDSATKIEKNGKVYYHSFIIGFITFIVFTFGFLFIELIIN